MPDAEKEECTAPAWCAPPVLSPSPERPDLDRPVDSEATVPETPSAFMVLALCRTCSWPAGLLALELIFEYW